MSYKGYMSGHSHDLTKVLMCQSVSHSVYPTLCDPTVCSSLGTEFFQGRILE